MVLGITGCPGSGKSIVAGELARNGWTLVNADDIGREVVEGDASILGELTAAFGDDILDAEGRLQRRELGRRAFADPEKTRELNAIVHPLLIELLKRRVGEMQSNGIDVVVDCALIFEWKIESIFDDVVCVVANVQIRRERIIRRDGRSAEEVKNLFAAQLPEIVKVRRAGIILKNNGSVETLKAYGKMVSHLHEYDQEVRRG